MPYLSDTRNPPIVIMAASGEMSSADWQALYTDTDDLLAREREFAVLLEVREVKVPDFIDLRECAVFLRERTSLLGRWHRGIACVSASPLIRGLLKGVVQLGALPMPIASFESTEEARLWLAERLTEGRAGAAARPG